MENIIVILIITVIISMAGIYIYKSKKKGKKCIGCPYCDNCSKKHCN